MKQIREKLPDGKWGFSREYEDINVAIATGHAHDWEDLPETTRAKLIARFRVKGAIEAFEDELAKQKAEESKERREANRRSRGMRR